MDLGQSQHGGCADGRPCSAESPDGGGAWWSSCGSLQTVSIVEGV